MGLLSHFDTILVSAARCSVVMYLFNLAPLLERSAFHFQHTFFIVFLPLNLKGGGFLNNVATPFCVGVSLSLSVCVVCV